MSHGPITFWRKNGMSIGVDQCGHATWLHNAEPLQNKPNLEEWDELVLVPKPRPETIIAGHLVTSKAITGHMNSVSFVKPVPVNKISIDTTSPDVADKVVIEIISRRG